MSALYRQARPTTFDEMVGQEHVKEVLSNALRQGRLSQAYLFSGPRGVGKTSSARLIAQAVNCTGPDEAAAAGHTGNSPHPKPCGVCEGCRLVREGRHPDVLEIDAASNNSVEDVRDLRERILLAPILSPQEKKVVILDEAHMMSKSAFNALLKTLEEPPPHVIFVFATTEPERMPPTILSRTQHFRFRRLSEAEIVQKLDRILQGIGREAEPAALALVARMADGAMRDAESLMDRLLTLEGPITLKQTEAALGLPPQEALFGVAEALDRGDIRAALEQAQNLYTQGFAARTLAQGLLEAIRAGLYGRMGLGTGPHLGPHLDRLVAAMTALDETLERLLKRSDALSLELAVLAAYQALHPPTPGAEPGASTEARVTPQPATPALQDFDPRPRRPANAQGTGNREPGADTPANPAVSPTPGPSVAPTPNIPTNVRDLTAEWRQVMGALKMTIRGFVREAEPRFDEGRVTLIFPERASFHFQSAQKNLEDIKRAVRETMGINDVELMLGKKKLADDPPPSRPFAPQSFGGLAAQVIEAAQPRPSEPPRPIEPPQAEVPRAPLSFEGLGQPSVPQTPPAAAPAQPPHMDSISPGEQPFAAPPPGQAAPDSADPLNISIPPAQPDPPQELATPRAPQPPPEALPPESPTEPDLPPLEDWTPQDTPFGESDPLGDGEPPPVARAETQTTLLDDPKYKNLVKLFGGRLRKFQKDAPKEATVELDSEAANGEAGVLEADTPDEG